jgi:putative CocE/NonD family hydrolase
VSQRGSPVYYGDRRLAPGQRLSFDAALMRTDTDVLGSPRLCLALKSDQTDGAVYAYLEDVAPDGRVTYLTEGLWRLLHRGPESADCAAEGGQRSFTRADGAAVVPGELMHVELPLLPTAARIARGHHLRLALAGADAGTFPLKRAARHVDRRVGRRQRLAAARAAAPRATLNSMLFWAASGTRPYVTRTGGA